MKHINSQLDMFDNTRHDKYKKALFQTVETWTCRAKLKNSKRKMTDYVQGNNHLTNQLLLVRNHEDQKKAQKHLWSIERRKTTATVNLEFYI